MTQANISLMPGGCVVRTHRRSPAERSSFLLIGAFIALLPSRAVSSRFPREAAILPAAAMESEYLFEKLAKSAEEVLEASGNWQAASLQLRTAFSLCPTCEHKEPKGPLSEVFAIDGLNDRLWLTKRIFPAILQGRGSAAAAGSTGPRILWAGVQPYTLRYEYMLAGAQVTSINPNRDLALWGFTHNHIVDVLQNIGKYYQPGSFEFAVVNGVVGWGIDTPEQVQDFLQAMHTALVPGGIMFVGYNEHIGSCCSFAPYFEPTGFGELPQKKAFGGHWRHVIEIYKPAKL